MAIIIFIVILSILVFVHEAGHFIAAKSFGIRVDEFGLGYPPRARKLFTWKGTDFTLNWLPFGGFVKIFGENPTEENVEPEPNSFSAKSKGAQAVVLVSGVLGNFLLAWVLMSIGLMMGMPAPENLGLPVTDVHTSITQVIPDSPAFKAGLKSGDVITSISRGKEVSELTPDGISKFIASSLTPVTISLTRGSESLEKVVTPTKDILPDRPAVGFALESLGIVKLGPLKAISEGLRVTWALTVATGAALIHFFSQAIVGHANLSEVTGPVGLVGVVGDVTKLGFVYLLSFTALISINLAIINLFPFPALDGGRLVFVIIEAIFRKPVPPRVFNWINTAGFALLVFLMILITFRDIRNIL